MSYVRSFVLMAVVAGSIRSATLSPMPSQVTRPPFRSACASSVGGMNMQVNWVTHTVADTNWYAVENRPRSGLPQTSADSVVAVTDEGICADLGLKFARLATARDTVTPAPVFIVQVRPSHYMVTDGKPGNPNPGPAVFSDVSRWTEAVTFRVSPDSSRLWEWVYSPSRPVPY